MFHCAAIEYKFVLSLRENSVVVFFFFCSCDGGRKPSSLTDSGNDQSLVTWRGNRGRPWRWTTGCVWGHNGMVLYHQRLAALSARSTWVRPGVALGLEAPRKAADEQHEKRENLNQETRWTGSWSLCLSTWVFASPSLPVFISFSHSFIDNVDFH